MNSNLPGIIGIETKPIKVSELLKALNDALELAEEGRDRAS